MLYKVYVPWYWYIINLIKHGPINTLWGKQTSEIAFVFYAATTYDPKVFPKISELDKSKNTYVHSEIVAV